MGQVNLVAKIPKTIAVERMGENSVQSIPIVVLGVYKEDVSTNNPSLCEF